MEDRLSLINTTYDVKGVSSMLKKHFVINVILTISYLLVFAFGVLAVILWGSYLVIFVLGTLLIVLSVFLFVKTISKINIQDYSFAIGEIVELHKDIRIVDTMSVGGVNPFGTRKYDTYKNDEIRIIIYIKDHSNIKAYYIRGVTDEHIKYYKENEIAFHIWGTRFPIMLDSHDDKWLCPICGAFNRENEKVCEICGNRIIE